MVELTLAFLLGLVGGWNANDFLTPAPKPTIDYCKYSKTIEWDTEKELQATPMPITRQIVENNKTKEVLCN